MKALTLVLLLTLTSFAVSSEEVKKVRKDLEVGVEKTEAEVIKTELQCIRNSNYSDVLEELPGGSQYLRDQLAMGAVENKRYYISVNDNYNIMYFRHGDCFFVHVNYINLEGEDEVKLKAFVTTDFGDCIRVLPEGCVWQGEREVKYVEICESGLDLSEGIKMDIFKVNVLEDSGVISPIDVWTAVRQCYQPNVYSVAFECFKKGLWFDPNQARRYMKRVSKLLQHHDYTTKLDMENYAIEYSKLKVVVKLNGKIESEVGPSA